MAEGDIPHGGNVTGFLQKSTAGLPNWAWILVIGAGIAAAIIIPKFLNKGTSTSTSDTSGSGLGLAIDPVTGLPYAVEGLVPSGGNAGGGSTTTSGTTATKPTGNATIRAKGNIAYDQTNTGVPLQSGPNINNQLGTIPFGSTIEIVGPAVTGGDNSQGNNLWYPVAGGGYVSAFDITGYSASVNNTGWPANYMRSRHFQTTG